MIPQTAMVLYLAVNVAENTTNVTNAAPISETFIVAAEQLSVWMKNICRIGDLTTIHLPPITITAYPLIIMEKATLPPRFLLWDLPPPMPPDTAITIKQQEPLPENGFCRPIHNFGHFTTTKTPLMLPCQH